jgi:hypothetical protein
LPEKLDIIRHWGMLLRLQKDFDAIGCPDRNAGSKEIRIFGP